MGAEKCMSAQDRNGRDDPLGCDTSSDHLYFYRMMHLCDQVRAAQEIGMRFHPTQGSLSLGAARAVCAGSCGQDEDVILKESSRYREISRCQPVFDAAGHTGPLLTVLGHARPDARVGNPGTQL